MKQLFGIDAYTKRREMKPDFRSRGYHTDRRTLIRLDPVEKTVGKTFTDSYLPVVNATDASVQVRQVWQKGSDWI